MPRTETQLESWARPGSTASSASVYDAIQAAISRSSSAEVRRADIYLQGSYRNDTNIAGESDVDVVVQHPSFFWEFAPGIEGFARAYVQKDMDSIPDSTYRWTQFRGEVYESLVSYFGARAVRDGNKCINVDGLGETRVTADVVPAFLHRLYRSTTPIEGMGFFTQRDHRMVVNYPRQHYDNGVAKQQATGSFKGSVRLFKNMRKVLVASGHLQEDVAPSYFIECMIANVPSSRFLASNWVERFVALYDTLVSADLSAYMCLNQVTPLFGSTPEQWDVNRARTFLRAVRLLWNA